MDTLDPLILARIQFAANITFHILFPTISISMAWVLLFFKLRFARTGQQHWMNAYQFWVKIFALTFALGVVSGITMSFQFGTNWPGFMNTVGNVAGPLLAYEVLTAFFLEATMLGIMLFGRGRVSERMHTTATLLVAGGTTLSAFWILALNSWMHTPAGFEMVNGQAHVTSWLQVIFNPSFPYRFTHMLLASGLTVSFLLAGISAWRWLKGDQGAEVRASLRTGLVLAAVLIPLQIGVGDLHGLNTLHHQPAKIAAMEGIWQTQRGAPAVLFALPDAATQSNRFEIAIPKLASWYLTHDWNGEIKGLKEWPREDRPPVAIVYFAFRIMVGMGLLMLLVVIVGWVMHFKGRLYESPLFLRLAHWSMPVGFMAVLAGWTVTEVGRQPWVVYGLLRTSHAVSPSLTTFDVALSFAFYIAAYIVIFGAGFMLLRRIVRAGPQVAVAAEAAQGEPSPDEPARPARPLSAATEAAASGAANRGGHAT